MNPWVRKDALVKARYGLQACRHLIQVFIASGDREAQAYFIQRQRHYQREISNLEVQS